QRLDMRCIGDVRGLLSSIPTDRPFLYPAKLIRGEQRFGAALLDAHVAPLKKTNHELEIVQYEQRGHHPHRIIPLPQLFSSDLEDFAMRVDSGVSPAGRATTRTTSRRSLENDSITLELGTTLGGSP